MAESVSERLQELRAMVEEARAVPMSASCIINRTDAVDLIDEILAHLPGELAEARRLLDEQWEASRQIRDKADEIEEDARRQAREIVSMNEIVRLAHEEGDRIREQARKDAELITREADLFIDTRFAEFEAGLQRTSTQIRTMRDKLAERSQLDTTEIRPVEAEEE